ncbi:MAG TPA: hypothetical protein PKY82_00295 [Pyrinomonadaceae bacterium]|nr:hypothetical protein [Pyrinomonadaceae bacterium]
MAENKDFAQNEEAKWLITSFRLSRKDFNEILQFITVNNLEVSNAF